MTPSTVTSSSRRSTDPEAIARRVQKLYGAKQAARYFSCTMTPLSKREQAALPKPSRGCKPATHRLSFTFDEGKITSLARYADVGEAVTKMGLIAEDALPEAGFPMPKS